MIFTRSEGKEETEAVLNSIQPVGPLWPTGRKMLKFSCRALCFTDRSEAYSRPVGTSLHTPVRFRTRILKVFCLCFDLQMCGCDL